MLLPYEFIPVAIGVVFIFGLIGFGLVRKSLADRERLKMREMIHRERMAAIEKNLPLEEMGLEDTAMPEVTMTSSRNDPITWIRFTALFLGLAFFFGGIGMSVAFRIAPEPGFNDIWSLGLIPTLTGFGLLIFYFMTMGQQKGNGSRGSG